MYFANYEYTFLKFGFSSNLEERRWTLQLFQSMIALVFFISINLSNPF